MSDILYSIFFLSFLQIKLLLFVFRSNLIFVNLLYCKCFS
jgi:hypothetical protein